MPNPNKALAKGPSICPLNLLSVLFSGRRKCPWDDGEKSISLNWWCETPPEFSRGIYDTATEVYFVGKLFEEMIVKNNLTDFQYMPIVRGMCEKERADRIPGFLEVQKQIASNRLESSLFSKGEIQTYREFADFLTSVISNIQGGAQYRRDTNEIIDHLERLHRSVMLEENLPSTNKLVSIFVVGGFQYFPRVEIPVAIVLDFLDLLKAASVEKRSIIEANIYSRLDAIERNWPALDDEIPF